MDLALDALWIILFLTAARAVGGLAAWGLRRWIEVRDGIDAGALGLAVESAVLFALAALQVLRAPLLRAAFGIAVLAGLALGVRTARRARFDAPWRRSRPGSPGFAVAARVGGAALGGVVLAVLGLHFVATCFPSVAWDAATYHLALPRLYLEHGGFYAISLDVLSNWPLASELLYALAMAVHDYVLAKLVHWAVAGLLVAALVRRTRADSPVWGWAAAALVLVNPVVGEEIGGAYVDLFLALSFLLGFLALEDAAIDGGRPRIAFAGVCAGMALATKPTGALVAACLAALLAWQLRLKRRTWPEAARAGLAFLLPVLALALPWLVRAWWMTGNPVYPFLYSWLDGRGWSATLAAQATRWQRSIGMGRSLGDYCLLPLRVILSGARGYAHFDGELSRVWLVALPVALAGAAVTPRARRALAAGGLYFALWALTSQQMRLLVPALPLFALAAAEGTGGLVARGSATVRAVGPSVAALGVVLGLARPLVEVASLAVGHAATLAVEGSARLQAEIVPPVFRYIAERTPADARVLLIDTNKIFFCPRPALADSMFEASQLADWLHPLGSVGAVDDALRAAGVTHVVIEHVDWGIAWPQAFLDWLGDRQRVRPVYRTPDGRFTVLERRRETRR